MTYDMQQLSRMEPSYLSAYGLNSAPFSTRHDDRFYFQNSELADHLSLLRHLIRFSNLMLIVMGESGIGKSSLKTHLNQHADDNWHICNIQSHTMMDAGLLLREVAQSFGLSDPPLDPRSILLALRDQLRHLQQQDFNPVLMIDDAHELPQDALEALFSLADYNTDTVPLLRILLFCEPQIETVLEAPAFATLRERVTHKIHLSPLNELETAEYLKHRMAVAGLDSATPFTPKLVHKLYRLSHGVPEQINEYAHQYLLDEKLPLLDEDVESPRSYNLKHIIAGGLALVVIAAVLLNQDKINHLFSEEPSIELSVTDEPPTLNETMPAATVASTDERTTAVTTPEKTIEFSLNQQQPSDTQQASQATDATDTAQTQAASAPLPPALALTHIEPNPVTTSKQAQTLTQHGEGFNDQQQVIVNWTGNKKILDSSKYRIIDSNTLELTITVGSQPDSWAITLHDIKHRQQSNTLSFEVVAEQTTQPSTESTKAGGVQLHEASWIKAQPGEHYTLQLLGTYQANLFASYLQKHQLHDDAAWFTTRRDGKPWYTLIYGNYADKQAALQAANNLQKGVNKPWLRAFASIQPLLLQSAPTSKPSTKPAMKPVITSMPSSSTISTHTAWLWSQNPTHYTLQIMAGSNLDAIQRFWQTQNLPGKAVYYHTNKNGQSLYVLVYGSYSNRDQAAAAIASLPGAIRNNKPWPRSFGDIHGSL